MCDPSTQPALGYMRIVSDRSAQTLCPIIQQHVKPETIIHSDEWGGYIPVGSLPNVAAHETVNHSQHFVDPATGVHTQAIESYWNRAKIKLKKMKGVSEKQLASHLETNLCGGSVLAKLDLTHSAI